MGFLDKLAKALSSPSAAKAQSSSGLAYTENGGIPLRDAKNRVVVKLASGQQIIIGVNKQHISDAALAYLMGKPKEDEEVSRNVRGRISRDLESQYPDSVKIETPKGDLVGWVLKGDSEIVCKLLDQLSAAVRAHDVSLQSETFAFDVSIHVTGYFNPLEDGDDASDAYDLDDLEIRIKDPVEMDIEAAK